MSSWNPTRWSLGTRLASAMVAVLAVVLFGAGTFMVVTLRDGLRERAHESLEVPYRVIEQRLSVDPDTSLGQLLQVQQVPGERRDEVIGQILDRDHRVVAWTGTPMSRPVVSRAVVAEARREGEWHQARRLPGRDSSDLLVVIPVNSPERRGSVVVLAQTLAPVDRQLEQVVVGMLTVVPLVLFVAFLGGRWIAATVLAPVDRLTRQAVRIDPGISDEQLPVPRSEDEIARLAVALNDMLSRLRAEIDVQRRFAADASHELRGPLARMITDLDVRLRSADLRPEHRSMLVALRDDADDLARIVDDLLLLARLDAGTTENLSRSPCDLVDLCQDTVRRFAPAAAVRSIELEVTGEPLVAEVDERLLAHAIGNLIDNAVKFGRESGTVTLRLATTAEGIDISVHDDGPGLAPADVPHVFKRFFRGDPARGVGGTGLGLAIVESCVSAHGGTVEAASAPGEGSTFTLHLPAPPAAPRT